MSGTVFAGANLEEVDGFEEVDELDRVDEVNEVDNVLAFENATVLDTGTCVEVVVAGALVVAVFATANADADEVTRDRNAVGAKEKSLRTLVEAAAVVDDATMDTLARTTVVVEAAAKMVTPKLLCTTARNPTNHATRTRRTPRRYSVEGSERVQGGSRYSQSRHEVAAGNFGQDGAKIGTCRIPQRPRTHSHWYRLSPNSPKSFAKSSNEFSPSP